MLKGDQTALLMNISKKNSEAQQKMYICVYLVRDNREEAEGFEGFEKIPRVSNKSRAISLIFSKPK